MMPPTYRREDRRAAVSGTSNVILVTIHRPHIDEVSRNVAVVRCHFDKDYVGYCYFDILT